MGITPPRSRRLPPLTERDRQRFLAKIQKQPDGCWLWNGWCRSDTGYGFFPVMFDTEYGRATGNFSAHRISYFLHKGEIPGGMDILHSCDIPRCVNPEHLRPGTTADNERDKTIRGRRPRGGRAPGITLPRAALPTRSGERATFAKLSDETIGRIREAYAADEALTARALARAHGVSVQNILGILTGRFRRSAPGPMTPIRPIVGEKVPSSKLNPESIRAIRQAGAAGETIYVIAPRFHIAPQTVSKIIRRETWKHIV